MQRNCLALQVIATFSAIALHWAAVENTLFAFEPTSLVADSHPFWGINACTIPCHENHAHVAAGVRRAKAPGLLIACAGVRFNY